MACVSVGRPVNSVCFSAGEPYTVVCAPERFEGSACGDRSSHGGRGGDELVQIWDLRWGQRMMPGLPASMTEALVPVDGNPRSPAPSVAPLSASHADALLAALPFPTPSYQAAALLSWDSTLFPRGSARRD